MIFNIIRTSLLFEPKAVIQEGRADLLWRLPVVTIKATSWGRLHSWIHASLIKEWRFLRNIWKLFHRTVNVAINLSVGKLR